MAGKDGEQRQWRRQGRGWQLMATAGASNSRLHSALNLTRRLHDADTVGLGGIGMAPAVCETLHHCV